MKHKIKMNIFSLETDPKSSIKHPRVAYLFQTHLGGGDLRETEGLFKRGGAYLI